MACRRRWGKAALIPPDWVDWFNHRRPLEPSGNIPPAAAEARYYDAQHKIARAG